MLVIPIVAALICLVLGLAWLFSIANVFYRDVEHLLAVVFLPWFFLTPGPLRARAVQRRQRAPLADPADALRQPGHAVRRERARGRAAGTSCPGAPLLLYIFVVGPLVALLGLWVMQRYEDRIAIEL